MTKTHIHTVNKNTTQLYKQRDVPLTGASPGIVVKLIWKSNRRMIARFTWNIKIIPLHSITSASDKQENMPIKYKKMCLGIGNMEMGNHRNCLRTDINIQQSIPPRKIKMRMYFITVIMGVFSNMDSFQPRRNMQIFFLHLHQNQPKYLLNTQRVWVTQTGVLQVQILPANDP